MAEITDAEMKAIAVLVRAAARRCGGGEDTMGAILYTGAFLHLDGDKAVANLAKKIDACLPQDGVIEKYWRNKREKNKRDLSAFSFQLQKKSQSVKL